MSMSGRMRLLGPIAVVGSALMIAPAQANACTGACKGLIEAKPGTPLRLDQHRTLGRPVRVVRAPSGDYAKVKFVRKPKADPVPTLDPPRFLPVVLSPEAAAAMAMRDVLSPDVANAMALVRIVEAEAINEIDLAAPVETTDQPPHPVRIVTTDEINEIDRDIRQVTADIAARQAAASPQQPTRAAAPSDARGVTACFERLGTWLVGTLTIALASMRSLLG